MVGVDVIVIGIIILLNFGLYVIFHCPQLETSDTSTAYGHGGNCI